VNTNPHLNHSTIQQMHTDQGTVDLNQEQKSLHLPS